MTGCKEIQQQSRGKQYGRGISGGYSRSRIGFGGFADFGGLFAACAKRGKEIPPELLPCPFDGSSKGNTNEYSALHIDKKTLQCADAHLSTQKQRHFIY